MKKFVIKLIVATIIVLTITNAVSMVSTIGKIEVKSLLSPFHFRIKVLNSLEYTTLLIEYKTYKLLEKVHH